MKTTVENGLVIVNFEETPRNQNTRLELRPEDAEALSEQLQQVSIDPDSLARRLRQSQTNFHFLLNTIDSCHALLCPDKMGTWQQRADQLLQTIAEQVKNNVDTP